MSVCGRVAFCGSHGVTMARPGPGGNRRGRLFPRLLRGLCEVYASRPAGTQESGLQQRFDPLVECLERRCALKHLAVDEKGRRAIDLQHLDGKLPVSRELVEQGLILDAIFDSLLAEAGLFAIEV